MSFGVSVIPSVYVLACLLSCFLIFLFVIFKLIVVFCLFIYLFFFCARREQVDSNALTLDL